MELPQYRVPGAKGVLIHMWERGKSFIIKAGTIIFASTVVIWLLSNFNTSFEMVDTGESMLAGIGNAIAPVFAPLGFGDWQSSVATITGLVARKTSWQRWASCTVSPTRPKKAWLCSPAWPVRSPWSAPSPFMAFNLLCAPCFAAIGAIKREMGNAKWTWAAIGYQTLLAYVVAFIIFQLGSVFVLRAALRCRRSDCRSTDRPYCMADGTQRLRPVEEEGNAFRCGSKFITKTD